MPASGTCHPAAHASKCSSRLDGVETGWIFNVSDALLVLRRGQIRELRERGEQRRRGRRIAGVRHVVRDGTEQRVRQCPLTQTICTKVTGARGNCM